ncbi:unnamed protein product [Rotaria sp. Silwood1]|nr:unnamed protein product [Rotaria sp. Silwood1]
MLKDFQRRYKLPVTGKLDQQTLKLMNTPRCGVLDRPLAFTLANSWPKKTFTWKWADSNFPKFGEEKTSEQLRESFNDWAKYAPITFQEVSRNEKADFHVAFADNSDGPGRTLAYAYFPTNGRIRFDPAESWTHRYDNDGTNFRLVATHEIGHALGLDHSTDPSSIMAPYYKLIQPEVLLPKDDRQGIQALYGTKTPPADEFTESKTCGCAGWCRERGKPYGVCGNGHTCICSMTELTKENIGSGCTCDAWCRNRGYHKGGVCGDGYTCICASSADPSKVTIKNAQTGLRLDSNADGQAYTVAPNGGPFQVWHIINTNENSFNLKNDATGLFLDSNENGDVYTLTRNGGANQKWTFNGRTIINVATGRALDSNYDGKLYTLAPNGGNFQNWIRQ